MSEGQPPQRSNPANVVAWIVMTPILLGIGYFVFSSATPQHVTVLEALAARSGRLEVSGEVMHTSEENLVLRAMQLGDVSLSSFSLGDASGELAVYFDPSGLHTPPDGAHVTAIGRTVALSGSGGTVLFVADELTTSP
jgi:hypothetical protein